MSKPTPGPWIAANHGDYSDYDGKCIVVLGEGGDIRTAVVLGLNNQETRANARLIAAAPELLEALRDLYEVCGGYVPDTTKAVWAKAYAAIAKATGEAK